MSKGKMTHEEFENLLESAELPVDYFTILNMISYLFFIESDRESINGNDKRARFLMCKGNAIYYQLENLGYYDNVKRGLFDDIR